MGRIYLKFLFPNATSNSRSATRESNVTCELAHVGGVPPWEGLI